MLKGRRSMEDRWGLADVLRLEVLAHRHEKARLSGRERMENDANREIIRSMEQQSSDMREWKRRRLLKSWMEGKWTAVYGGTSGNDLLESLQRTSRLTIMGGFFLGLLVHSLWSQLGNSVNVMVVFLTHVIVPLVLLLIFLINFLPGLSASSPRAAPRLWHPVASSLLGLSRRIAGTVAGGAEGEIPLKEVFKFVLQRRGKIVLNWVGMLIQRGAIAYLCGFWIWFVFQLLTRSAAFTWGTTLGSVVSADRVATVTGWINLPWGWLYSGPTGEQIAATQSWFGQSVPLVKSGWEAWAIFLMLAILVYAILPRVGVLLAEGVRLRWLLAREGFEALRFERIVNGMLTRTGINPDSPDPSELREEPLAALHMPGKSRKNREFDVGLIVSLKSIVDGKENELGERLKEEFQLSEFKWLELGDSAEGREALRERIRAALQEWLPCDHEDRVLHLVDGGQNPKQSYRSRIELIRELIGPQAGIVFVLIGGSEKSLQEGERIWLKSIRRWGDFNTDVRTLLNNVDSGAEEAPDGES